MLLRRSDRRRSCGAAVVEFAFVAPVFFMLLFGCLEYCTYLTTKSIVENAVREGARFAVVHTADKVTADVQAVVTQYLSSLNSVPSPTINVYKADPGTGNPLDANNNVVPINQAPFNNAAFGQGVAVQLTGTYTPIAPTLLLMQSTIPIQATSMMLSEGN
jgi:Flp pilus assembly protein TadG